MQQNWRNELARVFPDAQIRWDEPMAPHTTMNVGGPADAFWQPRSVDELQAAIVFAREQQLPLLVMGNGSNLIVRAGGIRGIVLQIGAALNGCRIQGRKAVVQAGCLLPFLAREVMQKKLAGLAFAAGIPGSVGGAVSMNAGAYGGTIADCLRSVRVIDRDNVLRDVAIAPGDMGYRTTVFAREGMTVVEAGFEFQYDTSGEARKAYDAFRAQRQEKQPLDLPSAGSVFKRPEGHFAGKLIEDAGLKGFSIGGAQVSPKHAGFIVNTGGATSDDVIELIAEVQRRVAAHSGIQLETEVKIVGS